jgi:hypothetical protein
VSATHLLLIILPASHDDLVKLMLRSARPQPNTLCGSIGTSKSVRLVVEGVDDVADFPVSQTGLTLDAESAVGSFSSKNDIDNVRRSFSLSADNTSPRFAARARAKSGGVLASLGLNRSHTKLGNGVQFCFISQQMIFNFITFQGVLH